MEPAAGTGGVWMRGREMQTGSTCLRYFTVTARATLQTYLCVFHFLIIPPNLK